MSRPGILVGGLCGALVTTALIASLFLAYALAGLPFVPFQIFDRAARTRPGSVIRPELTPLADHYRIDIDTFPPAVSERD